MIDQDLYNQEIQICREHKKKGGCSWGQCKTCGVIPLLYKLATGEVVDDNEKLKEMKEEI